MSNPQVRPDSGFLAQFAGVNGSLIAFICVAALFHLQAQVLLHALVGSLLVLVALAFPQLPWRTPTALQTWGGGLVLGLAFFDFLLNGSNLLPPMLRMVVHLLLLRVWQPRRPREDLQLLLLCVVVLLISGVLSLSLGFAFHLILFCPLVMAQLVAINLRSALGREARETLPSHFSWPHFTARLRSSLDWRMLPLVGVVFLMTAGMAFLVFTLLPRVNFDSNFSFLHMPAGSLSGFTEEVRYGSVSKIMESDSIAFVADFSDKKPPQNPYWRMIVLDRYHYPDKEAVAEKLGAFKLSETAKSVQVRENAQLDSIGLDVFGPLKPGNMWHIYLTPGNSRYLPFPGRGKPLTFSNSFKYFYHNPVNVIALDSPSSSVMGLQYSNAAIVDRFFWSPDDHQLEEGGKVKKVGQNVFEGFPVNPSDLEKNLKKYPFSTLEYPDDPASENILKRILAEIAARPEMAQAGSDPHSTLWAQAAVAYLHEKHTYSLGSVIPKGDADLLCRWLDSDQPGHCELFAGAFTLLARRQGYPCRMIGGYQGGVLSDADTNPYISVRNRHAHAWCEIFGKNTDPKSTVGGFFWFRVDPTGGRVAPTELASDSATTSSLETSQNTFSDRFDGLRVMWYRYIVNFDNVSRESMAKTAKERWTNLSNSFQAWLVSFKDSLLDWVRRPWDLSKVGPLGGLAALLSVFLILMRFWRRGWRPSFWPKPESRHDPIRRHASRLLAELRELPSDPTRDQLTEVMQELRFGDGSLSPRAQSFFGEARHYLRQARRRK